WRSMRSLILALLVVLVSVWLGQHFANSASFVLQLLSEALVFGSWVAIWFPLDSLVFGMWQFHLDALVYRRLEDMRLAIKPADEPTDRSEEGRSEATANRVPSAEERRENSQRRSTRWRSTQWRSTR